MKTEKNRRLIREGNLIAEIDVDLIVTDDEWAPYISPEDCERLDSVRKALKRGDVRGASVYGTVYELKPVAL